MLKIKQWIKSLFDNKENAAEFYNTKLATSYFVCNKYQSWYIKFLLNSCNLEFNDLINSLELEVCSNGNKRGLKETFRVVGSTHNILKFIHAMRKDFKIISFQEYIDVSRININ